MHLKFKEQHPGVFIPKTSRLYVKPLFKMFIKRNRKKLLFKLIALFYMLISILCFAFITLSPEMSEAVTYGFLISLIALICPLKHINN